MSYLKHFDQFDARFGRSSIIIEDCGFRDFGPNSGWDYALAPPLIPEDLDFLVQNLKKKYLFSFVGQV